MKKFLKALMTGVSYMLPFIVVAGMTIAVTGMLNQYLGVQYAWVTTLNGFAWTVMGFIPAVFAGYVSFAIADKPGIAPGFVGGYLAANPIVEGSVASGFLGAIIAGVLAGYLVNWMKSISLPSVLNSIKTTLFIPVISSWIIYFVVAYPLAMTVGVVNDFIIQNLITLSTMPEYAFLLGAILSAMCAFDMGGPLNKIAITFVFAVWADPSGIGFIVNAAVFPGIMVPALSVGIASLIAKSKHTESEIKMAPASIISGAVGITEAALPYAFRDPIKVITSNMIGAAVGGAIMMGSGISTAGVSGVFGLPMASNIPMFVLAILVGTAISVIIQVIWKKPVTDENQNNAENSDFEIEIDF